MQHVQSKLHVIKFMIFIRSIVLFAFIQIPFCMDIRNLVIVVFRIGKLYDNGE